MQPVSKWHWLFVSTVTHSRPGYHRWVGRMVTFTEQHQLSTMTVPKKVMEFRLDLRCLQGKTVTLPGVHDKDGRPILLVTVPPETPPLDIVIPLQYLLSIFSNSSRSRGITTILDARKGPWKVARSCIKQITTVFESGELAHLVVLRPDAFWDKQRVENCTSNKKGNPVIFIPRSRLNKFVDQSQLPLELGGSFVYNHEKWIENRRKVEEFYNDVETTLKDLNELHQYLLQSQTLRASQVENAINTSTDMADSAKMLVHNATEMGRELIQNIEYDIRTRKFATEDFESISPPQDVLDTIERIDEVLGTIRKNQQTIEEAWSNMERTFINAKDLCYLEEGVVRVTNWILGHAENLLNSRHKVGYDVSSAEELRREHESIEFQCWSTYGAYAEIIHKINSFSNEDQLTEQQKDIISQKDFMDFVCRSFALRLERRRNILITSLRFFRLVAKYFDKTSEVFDSLVMGNKVIEFQSAGYKLKELQESQANLDGIERELVKEGEKLSDMLSMPVKDALGREIMVDYSEDIVNIRDILDATTARKNIFSDSVELQKLTLEQVKHIDGYEKDANQAVQWLEDLLQVMLKDHSHVGCTVQEIQAQKEEHQMFQETAKVILL
ncbi:unnamed protein product [Brassicogethes aeneus]|uniref:SESTD1-like spectrin repeats region domain-containing protein n=1 Tax=Brassicogethes aeneus TaxID=1431903 RepID=A0A9P0AT07_BRAAE|nr:unnamed protein product [Brassicogethes aeneus]